MPFFHLMNWCKFLRARPFFRCDSCIWDFGFTMIFFLSSWNHDRNEILCVTRYPNPVFDEMWFLTIDPFIGISVFIAKLSHRWCCWRVLEDFHCQEHIQFFDIHNCLFMRLQFSIGGCDHRGTTRLRQSIHFNFTQVLFADHMHWRTGVHNKLSFLKFQRWCKVAPFLWRWEECCSFMLLWLWYIFGQLPRCFTGTLLLPLCLLLRPILKFRNVGATLMRFNWTKDNRAKDFRLEFWCDAQQPLWILHFALVSACLYSSGEKTSALKHTTQLSCIRWSTLRRFSFQLFTTSLINLPWSIVTFFCDKSSFLPITLLKYSHCTFVIILLRLLLDCSSTLRCA